jgi:hypothetical protein
MKFMSLLTVSGYTPFASSVYSSVKDFFFLSN